MDMQKIGSFIAAERRSRSLTQKELAAMLNITDKAVSKWERGLSLPDISLLNPLSECLGISVSELLNGERSESPTETDKELNNVITYAEQSSHSRSITFRRTAGAIFSAVMLLGIAVCVICDLGSSGALTWSLFPISSVIFAWAAVFPIIAFQRKGVLISLCSFTALLIPFIWVISRLTGVGMVFSAGWRISAAVIVYLWAVYGIFGIWSKRKHLAAGSSLIGAILLCITINLIVSDLFSEHPVDIWDILAYGAMGISAAVCFACDKKER